METDDDINPDFVQRVARTWYDASLPDRLAANYARILAASHRTCARTGATVDFDTAPANFEASLNRLAEGGS